VLADRYTLLSPLGRGGMGQVWEGRDERLGRTVAVKLLSADALAASAAPDSLIRRFTREAAVTAGLAHPGVPAIHDAGEHDGGLFLVMELVDGCTIGDLIAEQGPLPACWAATIGAQVAAVLAVAHERDIVHRDIKPQNVMITDAGAVKVLDFGVAGIVSQRITSTGVGVGTPAYMAPEQLHNLPATPRTDLYALGCLLYEMLTGEPVFTATSPAALMRMHLEQAPAPLRRGDLDPRLGALVAQLLQKDPARRPGSTRETYDRLLPHVAVPGRLASIDPAAVAASSTHLYARLLVRLANDPAGPAAPTAPPVPAMLAAPAIAVPLPSAPAPRDLMPRDLMPRRSAGWKLRHSLWILPTLLPFAMGTWLSFCYIGVRHGCRSWLGAAGAYLVLVVTGFTLLISGPQPVVHTNGSVTGGQSAASTAGLIILLALWAAGIIHAVWVNVSTRLPLLANGEPGTLTGS
jgi:Protein kinase domain